MIQSWRCFFTRSPLAQCYPVLSTVLAPGLGSQTPPCKLSAAVTASGELLFAFLCKQGVVGDVLLGRCPSRAAASALACCFSDHGYLAGWAW